MNEDDIVFIGKTNFRNFQKLFGIKRQDRRQHMYVIGKTGTGKSALLYNLIIQDIANGEGVCVIDPHGELVESLLSKIPEERKNDVIYFNPADPDYHIGFNILELSDIKYKHLVASGLMGIFTKIWANVWSSRMEYILNNAILALLDTPGSTLLSLSRLLVDREYRQKVVDNIKDPVIKSFWINEYEEWQDQFRNEAIAPIQNKVGQFLSSSIIRNVVGQVKSTINIFDIMNSGKIFLVNVSKGRIGEDNSALLGAMLITKMQLAAMERVRIPEEERVDFFLYVDEFQNFATDSFAGILSEARKYRLNLTLAHQYIGQLVADSPTKSVKIRDSIFGNVGTMIVFRVGAADAEFLEKDFEPEFSTQDLVNLPNYNICLKLMVNGVSSRPFSAVTLPPFQVSSNIITEKEIISISRKLYSRPRYIVEAEISNRSANVNKKILDGTENNADINDSNFEKNKTPRLKALGINVDLNEFGVMSRGEANIKFKNNKSEILKKENGNRKNTKIRDKNQLKFEQGEGSVLTKLANGGKYLEKSPTNENKEKNDEKKEKDNIQNLRASIKESLRKFENFESD